MTGRSPHPTNRSSRHWSKNYKIAPMDKLAIKVFKMDDLSGDYQDADPARADA